MFVNIYQINENPCQSKLAQAHAFDRQGLSGEGFSVNIRNAMGNSVKYSYSTIYREWMLLRALYMTLSFDVLVHVLNHISFTIQVFADSHSFQSARSPSRIEGQGVSVKTRLDPRVLILMPCPVPPCDGSG